MKTHGRRVLVGPLIVLALILASCGNAQERNLCRDYEDLQAAVSQIEELDPETATATDMYDIVGEVMAQLDQLRAASDGEYDQAISTLNLALTELRQVTFDIGDESLEVARPLMEESWEQAVTSYNALEQRLDVVCGTD
jgi:hypothetical protein